MRRIGTKRSAACVPAEMVELVAHAGHFKTADDLAVTGRAWIDVEHAHRIVPSVGGLWIERRDIGELLARRLHRHSRRGIKGLVGFPKRHAATSLEPSSATIVAAQVLFKESRCESNRSAAQAQMTTREPRLVPCKLTRKWRKSYPIGFIA